MGTGDRRRRREWDPAKRRLTGSQLANLSALNETGSSPKEVCADCMPVDTSQNGGRLPGELNGSKVSLDHRNGMGRFIDDPTLCGPWQNHERTPPVSRLELLLSERQIPRVVEMIEGGCKSQEALETAAVLVRQALQPSELSARGLDNPWNPQGNHIHDF